MSKEHPLAPLSQEQKNRIYASVQLGSSRETAVKYARTTLDHLCREMHANPEFAADVRYAEAFREIANLKNLQVASQDPKYWRISVWWLECRSPEQYGARGPTVMTAKELEALLIGLAQEMTQIIQNETDLRRLSMCLQRHLHLVRKMIESEESVMNWVLNPAGETDQDHAASGSAEAGRKEDDGNGDTRDGPLDSTQDGTSQRGL